ncbi:MAG: HlyD family efflux transporter periplasmic adaptor subunit [Planctomycetaceae bacterium]|nr:HlyD family efflux transporter periplasmic adaptor subunit [Planctomycetaceae bacterium]
MSRGILIILGLLVASGITWKLPITQELLTKYVKSEVKDDGRYILHQAKVGPFRITITENGTVDSLRNATLANSVEGTTTIISLVPEGSRVNAPVVAEFEGMIEYLDVASESQKSIKLTSDEGESKVYEFPMGEFTEVLAENGARVRKGDYIAGDVVCELDSSSLVENEKQQQINVTTARADLEKASKNLEIQQTTNESVLAQARLAEKLAKLDLDKYMAPDGEYQQAVETLQGEIKQFEEQVAMAQEDYEKVRQQARRGYTNLNTLEAARIKVTQQQILLDVKTSELKLLEKFTKERTESELLQTAEDSKRETERARLEGEAAMAGLKADYDARRLTLQVEEEKLQRLIRQIKACRLVASQQGEVVYASQNSRRSEPVIIEEGATVRERQAVINLPDLDQMKIDARIHESRISRIMLGQSVEISIDALPNITYHGILETVSSVPVPGNWPNTDLKEYEAAIRITDDTELVRQLKPGMTAEIRIIVDDREDDVLQVPVQSVLSIAGRFFTYVAAGGKTERRELKVGDANDEYMEILDGIQEGEKVIMNPRTHFSREINELEVKLLGELDANRPKGAPRAAAAEGTDSGPNRGPVGGAGGANGGPQAGRPAVNGGAPEGGNGGGQRGPGGANGGPSGGGAPDPAAIMERLDKNKDGVITKDESDMRGNFDRNDTDSDGKVTLEELKASFSNR